MTENEKRRLERLEYLVDIMHEELKITREYVRKINSREQFKEKDRPLYYVDARLLAEG